MEHHALLYVGSLLHILETLPKDERVPGADVRHVFLDTFSIADARALSHEANLRPIERSARTFIVAFNNAGHEAQNALLKTLEEPPATSKFRLIVPREDVLIATVRSRVSVTSLQGGGDAITGDASTFVDASYKNRLALVAEKTKEKDMNWVRSLLDGLEMYARAQKDGTLMEELLFIRRYIESKGSSKKMLLEHLALTLR